MFVALDLIGRHGWRESS